jgi:GTP pyrophosphokinase
VDSGERFEQALAFAARLHARQRRKGTDTPYVAHLLSVCALVLEHGGGEDEAIAALLHDAIEDQAEHNGGAAALRADIEARFGPRVLAIVEGCTDADVVPKPPWRERKEAYLAHLPGADESVRLVAAADKLHNLRSIVSDYRELGEALWPRFRGGRDGTLWYYEQISALLARSGPAALAGELARTLAELRRLLAAA